MHLRIVLIKLLWHLSHNGLLTSIPPQPDSWFQSEHGIIEGLSMVHPEEAIMKLKFWAPFIKDTAQILL